MKNGSYTSPEVIEKLRKSGHRKHSEEENKKHSEALKGKYTGEKNPFYGKHHSSEAIENNRQAHLNKRAVHKDGIIKMIDESDIESYSNQGWKLGNGIKRSKTK